jgi:hypothetical protein
VLVGGCSAPDSVPSLLFSEAQEIMSTLFRNRLVLSFIILWLILHLPAGLRPASASIVVRLTLGELVQQADLIVLGRCEGTSSEWGAKGKSIVTNVTIAAERCFKVSDCPPLIRIRQEGGTVDGLTMTVNGEPQFRAQERVLLFLERTSSSFYRVVGMSQGKFSVIQRGPEGKSYVKRDLGGLTLMKRSDKVIPKLQQEPKAEREIELDHFIEEIKSHL